MNFGMPKSRLFKRFSQITIYFMSYLRKAFSDEDGAPNLLFHLPIASANLSRRIHVLQGEVRDLKSLTQICLST